MVRQAGLEGVALAQYFEERLDQYLKVQPETPVIDVPQIEFDPLLDLLDFGRCTARAVALCPTGNSGFDVVAERIVAQNFFELAIVGQRMRPWPNE